MANEKCPNCGSTDIYESLTGTRCNNCGKSLDLSPAPSTVETMAEKDSNFNPDNIIAGDFEIPMAKYDEAEEIHENRPEINQRNDEDKRARLTTDLEEWKSNKDSLDFPGVDTPTEKPQARKKDKSTLDDDLLDNLF